MRRSCDVLRGPESGQVCSPARTSVWRGTAGEVWRLGGDNRTCVRLELGLCVCLVSALAHTGLVVTPGGELYNLTYKRGNKTRIEVDAELTATMRPTRIAKNSESLCLVHYQTKESE